MELCRHAGIALLFNNLSMLGFNISILHEAVSAFLSTNKPLRIFYANVSEIHHLWSLLLTLALMVPTWII